MFAILPFSYSYGNSLLLTHVAVGGRLVLASDFAYWKRVVELMEAQRVSGFAGIPASFAMLLARSDLLRRPMRHLRYLTCAGGALPVPNVVRLRQGLPHVRVFLMYGQTEASARLTTLQPADLDRKLGSCGRPIAGVSIAIRDSDGRAVPTGEVGEIVVQGDNVMLGYWRDPEGTREVLRPDGLHTGDLGKLDDEGFLYIVGRHTDMIKSGGYRISPQEIEDVLLELEFLAEAGVVGRSDIVFGEVPVAFVVPRPGARCACEDVIEHARGRLPRYKAVHQVYVVESLPRTANGKVQRAKLRELLARMAAPDAPS
jgi:acyl-CoA synthetase (AMP-forming)/AMP-acid ligase II